MSFPFDRTGLDAADIRKAAALAEEHRSVLDEITEPRLLAGDLWTVNTMIAAGAPEPTITGVLDLDRTAARPRPGVPWSMGCVTSGRSGWSATAWATPTVCGTPTRP
ncbi:hypothetical protein [Nonomuraea sp. CA-141351]|uniref:hypothetical protein n=1 Tax=Nonomuraea sp. CA-141351 TaxID=3239996 RepID=UPI003D9021C6